VGTAISQYYCGNCSNVLKEVESEIQLSHSIEPCPYCGTLLSDTLQKRALAQKPRLLSTVFQKASRLPKLTLDIPQLDQVLHFLTPHHKVCIAGIYTQKLIERLCVRAQLPHRYGGLDTTVLLIDGANSSDLYQCVDFAQQYGLDVRKVLRKVISSRSFTVYQLANLIINKLESAIKQYDAKLVVISNLLYFFTNDPYLDTYEMKVILKQVIKSIQKIENCLVVVSLGFPTQYDEMVLQLFSKIIRINQSYNTLSIHINNDGSQNTVLLKREELETIPQH